MEKQRNLNKEMEKIEGVIDSHYNPGNLTLAIYYDDKADLQKIQAKIFRYIDYHLLDRAIEKVNFISVEKESKKLVKV